MKATIVNPTVDEAERLLLPLGKDPNRMLTYTRNVAGQFVTRSFRPYNLVQEDRKDELAQHFYDMQEAEVVIITSKRP